MASGTHRFFPRHHDDGEKSILGQQGHWQGGDLPSLVSGEPALALNLTRKFWQHYISPIEESEQLFELAASFRESGYSLPTLLHGIFSSEAFWAPENRSILLKGPADFLLQISTHSLRNQPTHWTRLMGQLGQRLLNPPNVKGWPGGIHWLSGRSIIRRIQIARGHYFWKYLRELRRGAVSREALRFLWLADAPSGVIEEATHPREFLNQLIHDPALQLK